MKNRSILFLAIFFFFFSCSNTSKLIRKGLFDKAFKIALHRVIRNPENTKEVHALITAYQKAQQNDSSEIVMLKKKGDPSAWEDIFDLYNRMAVRQNNLKPVLPLKINGKIQHITLVDYQNEVIEAQKKADEYYYVHGKHLLASNDKEKARQAYYEFKKIRKYYTNYKDVDSLINQAYFKGIRYVAIYVENKSLIKYSKFLDETLSQTLLDLNTPSFNRKWVQYRTYIKKPPEYHDYAIIIIFKDLYVLPETIDRKNYNKEKEIENGWQYVLDENGNVMKDSLGNDIKIPKIEKIFCNVTEFHLHKEVHAKGKIVFYDNTRNRELKYLPIGASQVFDYVYATANGNLNALDDKTRKLTEKRPVAFPPTPIMVDDVFKTLRASINNAIAQNKNVFK